jgi:hypothetical protein
VNFASANEKMTPMEKKNLPAVTSNLPALALANDLAGQVAPNVGRYLTLGLEGAENTRLA